MVRAGVMLSARVRVRVGVRVGNKGYRHIGLSKGSRSGPRVRFRMRVKVGLWG